MKTYIVQLETHDDVLSTKDKIAWSKATRVLLVWPRKGSVLDRRVDLLLLQRTCQQLGVQMAVVTRSSEVKAHARDLGIPVFASPVKAQSQPWRRGRRGRKPLLESTLNEPNAPLDPVVIRQQRFALTGQTLPQSMKDRAVRLGLFTAGVLAFLALALFFAPQARVELTPQRSTQSLTIPVWASPDLRVPNPSGGVPAHVLTAVIEGRDQGESTGRARIADGTATGQVQLTNLTDQQIEVLQGSVVQTVTGSPVRFLITQSLIVPAGAGKTAVTTIRAALPGSTGSVGAGKIRAMEGPVGLRLAVDNPLPTSGGLDRMGPAPSKADYQALKDQLMADMQSNALREMRDKLKSGQRLLEPTLVVGRVIEETHEPPEAQPADRFQLILQLEFTAWYVEESDLRAVSQAALEANRKKDFQPAPDSMRFEFATPPQVVNAGSEDSAAPVDSARWQLKIERTLESGWSKEQVLRAIQGRPVGDAVRRLTNDLPLAGTPRIQLFPSWWGWLPFLPFRIEMVTL